MAQRIITFIFFLFIVNYCTLTTAQIDETQWWGNYTYHQNINDQWQVSTRLEMRYISLKENFYRTGLSPKVQYKSPYHLKYIIGSRFFYYDTDSRNGVIEYRPWLGLKYSHPSVQRISLTHQVKWEHRIFGDNTSTYESRLRYKLQVAKTLFKNDDKFLKIGFAPELFWSFGALNDGVYKNTRWGFPVSYQYNEKLVMEIVPFMQTNYDSMLNLLNDGFGVIQLNLKTFL